MVGSLDGVPEIPEEHRREFARSVRGLLGQAGEESGSQLGGSSAKETKSRTEEPAP